MGLGLWLSFGLFILAHSSIFFHHRLRIHIYIYGLRRSIARFASVPFLSPVFVILRCIRRSSRFIITNVFVRSFVLTFLVRAVRASLSRFAFHFKLSNSRDHLTILFVLSPHVVNTSFLLFPSFPMTPLFNRIYSVIFTFHYPLVFVCSITSRYLSCYSHSSTCFIHTTFVSCVMS